MMAEYLALEDEERREGGREVKAIHPHSPHVPKVFPLRRSRSEFPECLLALKSISCKRKSKIRHSKHVKLKLKVH
jgi:hypothetical protein